MASSYSTSLKIQLMGNGEDSGTWGSISNTNWNLIEQAVAGVQSITMANANYTLSNLNGVSDEARNMVLVVGGTNSAIYQVIIPTNQPKFYVVTNSTVGGFAITIGTSGGSVITVPTGTTIQVYTDGTNTFSAQTSSAGNFNVNGNLTVGGTLAVTGASTFTGIPSGPTAASGTNTTQLATTAFVTTAVSNAFPAGTRLVFAQAAAPTGWTQDTSDTANNRMMRVVNTTGGGVGGTASPILMDVVPNHTHGFSTGTESVGHYHYTSGTTSTVDINHYHSGATAGMNGNNPHSHSNAGAGALCVDAGSTQGYDPGGFYGNIGLGGTNNTDINHTHNFDTGYMSANNTHNHTYGANSGGESTTHTHSGTTNSNSGSDWAPRYVNLIICQKN